MAEPRELHPVTFYNDKVNSGGEVVNPDGSTANPFGHAERSVGVVTPLRTMTAEELAREVAQEPPVGLEELGELVPAEYTPSQSAPNTNRTQPTQKSRKHAR